MSKTKKNRLRKSSKSPRAAGIADRYGSGTTEDTHLQNLLNWIIIIYVAVLPVVFNPYGYNMFPFIKAYLLYATSIVTLVLVSCIVLIKRKIVFPRIALLFGIYLLVMTISTILSIHLKTAIVGEFTRFEGLISWMCYLWMAYLGYTFIENRLWKNRLLTALCIGLAITSVYGLIQLAGLDFMSWQTPWTDKGFSAIRVHSTIGNPSTLGAYLILVLPIIGFEAIRSFRNTGNKKTLILGIVVVLGLITLAGTYSRGAWLGLVIALLAAAVLSAIHFIKNKRNFAGVVVTKYMIIAAVCIVMVAGAAIIISPTIKSRVQTMFDPGGNSSGRILLWKQSLRMISDRPVFGWGLDTFQIAYPKYVMDNWDQIYANLPNKKVKEDIVKSLLITDNAHNFFLQNAVGSGLSGLIALLAILIVYFKKAIYKIMAIKFRTDRTDDPSNLAVENQFYRFGLLAAITTGLFAYLVALQFHFSTIHVSPLFWLFLGIGLKLTEKIGDPQENGIEQNQIEIRTKRIGLSHGHDGQSKKANVRPTLKVRLVLKVLPILTILLTIVILILMFAPVLADMKLRSGMEAFTRDDIKVGIDDLSQSEIYHPWEEEYPLAILRNLTFIIESNKDKNLLKASNDALLRAERLNPIDANLFFYKGDVFFADGEINGNLESFTKAARVYERLVKLDPGFAKGRLRLGACYFALKQYSKAIQQWSIVATIVPDSPNPLVNIAYAYEKMGRVKEARRYYKKILSIDRKNQRAQEGYNRTSPKQ